MGNNKFKGNKNRDGNRNNYFSQAIQRNQNFIEETNTTQLERDSLTIFRQLARGDINVNTYFNYLTDDRLLYAMSSTAYKKLNTYSVIYDSISYRIGAFQSAGLPVPVEYQRAQQEYDWKKKVFEIIYTHVEQTRLTKDASNLISMIPEIRVYRFSIE
jgi:hypothetical protein